MKASDMRAMSQDELFAHLKSLAEQAINLRFQRASSTLDNTSQLRGLRREYARARTILHQRKAQGHKTPDAKVTPQEKKGEHHGR